MGDSVAAAKTGQKTPDGYYNMEKMIKVLIRKRRTGKSMRHLHRRPRTNTHRASGRRRKGA